MKLFIVAAAFLTTLRACRTGELSEAELQTAYKTLALNIQNTDLHDVERETRLPYLIAVLKISKEFFSKQLIGEQNQVKCTIEKAVEQHIEGALIQPDVGSYLAILDYQGFEYGIVCFHFYGGHFVIRLTHTTKDCPVIVIKPSNRARYLLPGVGREELSLISKILGHEHFSKVLRHINFGHNTESLGKDVQLVLFNVTCFLPPKEGFKVSISENPRDMVIVQSKKYNVFIAISGPGSDIFCRVIEVPK